MQHRKLLIPYYLRSIITTSVSVHLLQVSALEEGMERLQAEMSQARQDFASEKKTVLELVVSCVSPPAVWVGEWLCMCSCAGKH